ncbi:MAG: hypothetical protein SVU88_03355, partial [Candidatus Nanohaloarchaea archaeon]|nr:hypothetical protein [Candidatus Nanohaloarchaea archaeon]
MADSDGADSEQSTEQLLRELQSRIDTLEDQVMMERLEDLSLEDEIEVVEDLLDRDEEAIQEKLEMLDRIEEEYEETQVGEKLQYLYQQLTDVQDRLDEVAGQQVDEEEVSELRGRIDRLESEVASTGDEEQNFDDVYDKLYTLRDRLNEVKEEVEEGAELSDAERDALIREIEGRVEGGGGPSVAEVKRQVLDEIDVSSTGASVEDIREQVLDGITAEDVSQAALEDMQDEIDKLRGRLDAQEDIGGGDGGASGELRSRVAELEGKVEELEQRSGGSTDAPESAGPAEVEGLRDELDELREEVAEAARADLEDEISALRDDMEDIRAE